MSDPSARSGSPAPAPNAAPGPSGAAHPTPPSGSALTAPPGAWVAYQPMGSVSALAPTPPRTQSSRLGVLAFVLAAVAALLTSAVAGVLAFQIGSGADLDLLTESNLRGLTPVRDLVVWAEVAFWLGTLLGIAGIILAIIAIVRRSGRGWGTGALVLGIAGPVIFGGICTLLFMFGASTQT